MHLLTRLALLTTFIPTALSAQASIPVRNVAAPIVSAERFTANPNVRGLPDGRLLVNDFPGKRIIVFDSLFASFTVSADSSASTGVPYPATPFFLPMIPFSGDSTLFIDIAARSYVVIDHSGRLGRAMAAPKADDLMNVYFVYAGNPGTDKLGRLIYAAPPERPTPKPGAPPSAATRDTFSIVRADFNSRVVDTIGLYTAARSPSAFKSNGMDGKPTATLVVNPLPAGSDEWAVMSDGTVAVVRQHDYHVDWIAQNGTTSSSPKLPFDWKRITDEDKAARIDSVKHVIDSLAKTSKPYGQVISRIRSADGASRIDTILPTISFAPNSQLADYVPPIRQGSVKADEDNHLWILPTTSSQAGVGLVYDVVNRKGELFERVRLPADCVLAGFGRGGVLYVAKLDKVANMWSLLRTHVQRTPN